MEKYERAIKDNPEIFHFFIYFSRFEFVLKNNKEWSTQKPDGTIDANWDKFASSLKETLVNLESAKASIDYLMCYPPKKRTYDPGNWITPNHSNEPNYKKLCLYVRTVRNNLFHGDKFDFITEIGEQAHKRDLELINHCLEILKAWSKLPELNGLF